MSVTRVDQVPESRPAHADATDPRWIVAAVLLSALVPLAIFAPTFLDMVQTWRLSDTFAHCFLVYPAFAYLVWRERDALARSPVRPAPLALLGLFAVGLLLVLGTLAAARTPSFFGLVGASIFTVIAVLGWRVAAVIWVPLLFLLFAVPFGDIFVPTLIEWTADFTVLALSASGVPVFREGPNFVIPSGSWAVVDACSGVRYVMASAFAGWLFAWLTYRSTVRRLAFMALSLVIPIVANWVRAYMIVMLAHLSDNRIATGVDHLVYGWIFFGVVIGLMFMAGLPFREDGVRHGSRPAAADAAVRPGDVSWRAVAWVAVAAAVLAGVGQFASLQLARAGDRRPVVVEAVEAAHGWSPVAEPPLAWKPALRAPAATLTQHFEKDGRQVSLHVGVYRNQSQESELVNALNDLAVVVKPWRLVATATQPVELGQGPREVDVAFARSGTRALVVWQWYWIDGDVTRSDVRAKATLAVSRLVGRSDTSAWVALHAADGDDGNAARAALQAFAAEMGPAIDAALRRTAER